MAHKLGRFLVNTGRGVITPIAGRKAPVRREKTQFFADASVTYNKTGPVMGSCVVRTASAARISRSIVPLSSRIDEDGNSPFMKYTTDEPSTSKLALSSTDTQLHSGPVYRRKSRGKSL